MKMPFHKSKMPTTTIEEDFLASKGLTMPRPSNENQGVPPKEIPSSAVSQQTSGVPSAGNTSPQVERVYIENEINLTLLNAKLNEILKILSEMRGTR